MNYLQTRAMGGPPHRKVDIHALRFAAFHRAAYAHRGHSFALCTKSVMTYSGSAMSPTDRPPVRMHREVETLPFSRLARLSAGYLLRLLLRGEKIAVLDLSVESATRSGQSLVIDRISVLRQVDNAMHSGLPGNHREQD